jgi:hypothetical protein
MSVDAGPFRRASLVTGVALAIMAVVAGLSNFGVVERLATPADAEHTARDIAAASRSSGSASPACSWSRSSTWSSRSVSTSCSRR